ncbi:MAG: cysteine desulfurase [Deltaproteobacteria bacterium]|nr:cysteine desulfurase [Deltaproteobacteria bacterium]
MSIPIAGTTDLAKPVSAFDVEAIRAQFPILHQEVHGHPLVYLDNAATTQKPRAVLDAIEHHYTWSNANVHRGVHTLSERATVAFENARRSVQRFLGADDDREIVFTRGTTEAINLVANTFGQRIGAGDEILLSHMEHHSNIVPWQLLAERTGAVIKVVPVSDAGELDLRALEALVNERTRLVGCVYVSNTLGTINPVHEVVQIAHAHGVPVLLDGAQASAHLDIDVQAIGCDFYAISGHKVYGPTGIGALYGRLDILEELPPWQGGGDMILSVDFAKTTYNRVPHRFEAGTPNVGGAIGFAAALDWLTDVGVDAAAAHEETLRAYATARMEEVPGLRMLGTAEHKVGVLSFVMEGVHPHDIGTIVDQQGVAIRTGHHCTQPLMKRFGIAATARASLAVYNTRDDVDRFVAALHKVREVFR